MINSLSIIFKNIIHSSQFNLFSSVHTFLPIIIFIILLPHLITISPFISLYIVTILLWFTLHTLGIISLPGRLLRFSLVVIALFILMMNYGILFSQKASLSLLSIMVCLKLLEIHNELDRRNIFLILFLGYFVLITHFLHSQDIILSIFVFLNSIILTLMLSSFNRKPQSALPFKDNIRLITHLFVKALPIAIILFLFFPRIPGPLWSLPEDGQSSSTGLSDTMYPGSVSELVDSDEIAFRIDFNGTIPSADKLYWRGPVLSETDGFLWSQKKPEPLRKSFPEVVQNTSDPLSYTITMEPHQKKWLFALEMPTNTQGDTIEGFYLSTDFQLLNKYNIHQLTQYDVTSATQFFLNQVTEDELKAALKFPSSSNPETYQLGKQWQATYNDPRQIVLTGLNYFKNNPFYYTKKPEVMLDNPSDQFLFDELRGFCEHYASSFVLLMRSAGVPARVVTGYQGIEKNDVGNYYIVRQSNAHAWAEVWLEDDGWLRVDPTTMIPANRIEADIFQTNLERLNFSSLNFPDLPNLSAQQKTTFYNFYKQLKQSIDNIKHSWNNWILGYDKSKQGLLLKLMGLNTHWQTLIFLLLAAMISLVVIIQLVNIYQQHRKTDKVYHHYLKFINKLNRAGMSLQISEGPEAVKQKAIIQFPQQRLLIQNIINHYIQIRYGSLEDLNLIKKFIKEVQHYQA
ncbi:MAG: DUF3488 and transglutaminase-like domain-containing protein [gamma proteobacterium symbiont of Bathyaustriella thionipta]|nr:DUF3488 and transglutaminase-like domain-containing protein [gamma proteobacterium symbiont of Bathyaustriella thionipta]MCU7951511.1 DUF3488 and transglutaminase-like domain-containing protein [gamma proteobacterium symbiont of Bathyaustriella thionipta]MCU7952306.1 DUF3488 and transglutaminase-like domain-containing protein [gamma proteobacterium symbiont of Bathyaustriella thionipta]MCU7958084.1 DUF3488 and transglutaminase-like domain-containing protein [gamma proteobacterium symbiont of 